MAPEIPMAMYKLEATGLPVCPTCSECGRQPKSDTGLEQAVAAFKTSANSSIIGQFSGPFRPLPAETTVSASAMVTLPVTLSILSDFIPDVAISASKFSVVPSAGFS